MKILGIAAPKGSGKSTLAGFIQKNLVDNYQQRVKILPFAAPLKRMCWILFGGGEQQWYGTDAEKSSEITYWKEYLGEAYSTPRRILQTVGTEIMRNNINEHFWILVFNKMLRDWYSTVDVVIVDDVRFTNEAEYLRKIGGRVIHLHRNDNTWSGEHASEKGPGVEEGDTDLNFNDLQAMKEYSAIIAKQTLTQKVCSPL